MDPARRLLQDFAIYREQHPGHTDYQAFRAAIEANPLLWDQVRQRPQWIGHAPEIGVGEDFRYRTELMLAGLHNARMPGICVGRFLVNDGWQEVATCIVAKYGGHNYNFDAHVLIYGGEGGHIAAANVGGPTHITDMLGEGPRIIAHQQWTAGNRALYNSLFIGTAIPSSDDVQTLACLGMCTRGFGLWLTTALWLPRGVFKCSSSFSRFIH